MPKLKLDTVYLYRGQRYGPGNVEVPEEAVEDLKAAQERVSARNEKRMEGLRKQGIRNPKPAPIHEEVEEEEEDAGTEEETEEAPTITRRKGRNR